jgi:hypothetical protein
MMSKKILKMQLEWVKAVSVLVSTLYEEKKPYQKLSPTHLAQSQTFYGLGYPSLFSTYDL